MKGDRKANRRIRLLLVDFRSLVFAGTLARAAWLQGVSSASLGRMAQRQHRESIRDSGGAWGRSTTAPESQLAIGEQTTTIYADPRELTEPRKIAVAAHKLLGVNANQLYPQLINKKTGFVYVARFADPKAAATFLSRKFTGVNSYPEEKRVYPQGTVGSQLVGYAGTDNKGLAGLEVEYDKALGGKPGEQTIVRDRSAARST